MIMQYYNSNITVSSIVKTSIALVEPGPISTVNILEMRRFLTKGYCQTSVHLCL